MTPHLLLVLPVAIPLTTLAVCALLQRHETAQRAVSLTGSTLLLLSSVALLVAFAVLG